MTKKEMKSEIRKIWIDQIKTAMNKADEAIEGCEDNGTCNFDMVMIRKEKTFTYDETIAIFKECGINASRGSEWSRYYNGLIGLPNYKGQAEKKHKMGKSIRGKSERTKL